MSMHVGRSVKMALAQRNRTIVWLAEQLSISKTRASNIANSRYVQSRTIEKLADLFGIKPSELIALGEFEIEEQAASVDEAR